MSPILGLVQVSPDPILAYPKFVKKEEKSAQDFLCWSMDRYASFSTFKATADVRNAAPLAVREISYCRPNLFSVESVWETGHKVLSVCDGKRLVETPYRKEQAPRTYTAPSDFWSAKGDVLSNPMFCGSPLYGFFGGSSNLTDLANLDHAPVEFGDDEDLESEKTISVRFRARGSYGDVRALIGRESGLVYKIEYNVAPMVGPFQSNDSRESAGRVMRKVLEQHFKLERLDQMESLIQYLSAPYNEYELAALQELRSCWETYQNILVNADASPPLFNLASNYELGNLKEYEVEVQPLIVGKEAPDVMLCDFAGNPSSLSNLKGHIVLIYIWAPWCKRSRNGLVDIAKLSTEGREKGIRVIAVSDGSGEELKEFRADPSLQALPFYTAPSGDLWSRYRIEILPTTMIIDKGGALRDYLVSLRPADQLRAALVGAGFGQGP